MQVREFDKPSTLLDNPASMFNRLVEDTGPVASAMLRQMAAAGPQDGHHPEASSSSRSSRGPSDGGAEPARAPVELPLPPAVGH